MFFLLNPRCICPSRLFVWSVKGFEVSLKVLLPNQYNTMNVILLKGPEPLLFFFKTNFTTKFNLQNLPSAQLEANVSVADISKLEWVNSNLSAGLEATRSKWENM